MDNERAKRPPPERFGPRRDFAHWFSPGRNGASDPERDGDGTAENGPPDHGPGQSSAAERGVQTGYRIIEEHVRAGQRAASSFSPGWGASLPDPTELQQMYEGMLRQWMEMWQGWLGGAGGPGGPAMPMPIPGFGMPPGPPTQGPVTSAASDGARKQCSFTTRQGDLRVCVRTTLHAAPRLCAVRLEEVRPLGEDAGAAPLQGVQVQFSPQGELAEVSVELVAGQAAGEYRGFVTNAEDGFPIGVVEVSVTAAEGA